VIRATRRPGGAGRTRGGRKGGGGKGAKGGGGKSTSGGFCLVYIGAGLMLGSALSLGLLAVIVR